jgi:hypothetical protein
MNDEQMKLPSRGVLNLIWKIAIPTTTSPSAKNSGIKREVVESFER